jgi:uncharacterized membrane protein YhhN
MTQLAWLLLALAAGLAVTDWIAVAHSNHKLRWITKPGVMVLLIGVAFTLRPAGASQRDVFAGALFLSLIGDIYLLLQGERWFLAGLVAFLAAHLAYIDGFLFGGLDRGRLLYSALAVALVSLLLGGYVLRSMFRGADRRLVPAVSVYLLAISAMVALAAATGRPASVAGAGLFYASDSLIAWNRFMRPFAWAPLAVIVTYHLGQAGLVLSLLSSG